MTSRHPLARRIVIAFVLMTVLVSGAFSLSIVAVVHFVEQHLVSLELQRELENVQEDLRNGRTHRLDSRTRLYGSHLPEFPIPEPYKALAEGFSEIFEENKAFYAYTLESDGKRYLLVQEQDEFEAREHVLFNVVLAGFIFSVLGAWVLGRVLAGKVMAPISRLAQQVRHRDQLLALAPPLAPQYADDEVGQLAAAFDSTLGRLRQSLERERLFTSDVSHELRTPLMVISTSCELLEDSSLTPRQHERLARIDRASNEMRDLVHMFLQLARGQSSDAEATATASLAQVAERQCGDWGALMKAKGLDFQCVNEGEDNGRYSPILLGTVMSNLLRNALHYTEHGHVRLSLENGGFRVEDSGTGIPVDQRELIFQPFVRGTPSRGEGLGLGLSLVKRICSHQGWGITVRNLESGGSCFAVRLTQAN